MKHCYVCITMNASTAKYTVVSTSRQPYNKKHPLPATNPKPNPYMMNTANTQAVMKNSARQSFNIAKSTAAVSAANCIAANISRATQPTT